MNSLKWSGENLLVAYTWGKSNYLPNGLFGGFGYKITWCYLNKVITQNPRIPRQKNHVTLVDALYEIHGSNSH